MNGKVNNFEIKEIEIVGEIMTHVLGIESILLQTNSIDKNGYDELLDAYREDVENTLRRMKEN